MAGWPPFRISFVQLFSKRFRDESKLSLCCMKKLQEVELKNQDFTHHLFPAIDPLRELNRIQFLLISKKSLFFKRMMVSSRQVHL